MYIVGQRYGDEIDAFISFIDGMVLVGGGIAERRLFDEFNGAKWKFTLSDEQSAQQQQQQQPQQSTSSSLDSESEAKRQ